MIETDRIECVVCNKILFTINYIKETDDFNQINYDEFILYNNQFFCIDCIKECKKCLIFIDEYNNINNYCVKCYKKIIIKNTYNDITKTFPVELVDHIVKNIR